MSLIADRDNPILSQVTARLFGGNVCFKLELATAVRT